MIVIDCSYALAIVMPDERQPRSLARLADDDVVAPPIWPYEVANAFRSAVRRGRLADSDVLGLSAALESLRVAVSLPEDLSVRRSYAAAMTRGLSAYDASYIELALQRGAALATLDRNLADAARTSGLSVLS